MTFENMTYEQRRITLYKNFNNKNVPKYINICLNLNIFDKVCPLGFWNIQSKYNFLAIICDCKYSKIWEDI